MTEAVLNTTAVRRWNGYSAYRTLQDCWTSQIPADWNTRRLKFLAAASKERLKDKPEDLPYLGLEHLESNTGQLLLDNEVETVESNMGAFEKGDVLFGKLRPYLAKVAAPAFEGVCTTELIVYRPNGHIRSDYLKYQLLSSEFIAFVNSCAYGTKMPRVSESIMGNVRLTVPPLAEQQAIAAFLDRETARIDTLIGHKQRLVALLEEKRQAVISHAVTRGLDPSAKMKASDIEWLGSVPAHWSIKRLKYISPEQLVGLVINPSTYVDPLGNVPFLFGSNVLPGRISLEGVRRITTESNQAISKSILRAGDLVTVRVGAPGITAVIPKELDGCNCASVLITRGSADFDSNWLCYAMNASVGDTNVALAQYGAAQEQFNVSHAVNFLFPVPPLQEQQEIAKYLKRHGNATDTAIARIEDGIERLHEYRTALISAAVTGQIDVREQG